MDVPTEAIEAAAKAMFGAEQCDRRQMLELDYNWQSRLNERDQDEYRDYARAAIEAAMPAIREHIAQEIEAATDNLAIYDQGRQDAARIVRGGAQ